ncbi:MAG: alpha-L-rhamnosidase C-terminal domain-containing protein [Ignavibacteriaceae bacterium]
MKKLLFNLLILSLLAPVSLISQRLSDSKLPSPLKENKNIKKSFLDPRIREYIYPSRIIWQTADNDSAKITNPESLINKFEKQVTLEEKNLCVMSNNGGNSGILLDFGTELQGGAQIMLGQMKENNAAKFRIRFGESAEEAMSDIGGIKNATNDHSVRDFIISAPWLGTVEVGNTGFRFVRIDLLDQNRSVPLLGVRAVFLHRDLEYKGSFTCSDTLLNKIWNTGAYTVQLCMQDYLWDGIKRDRLVWIGDMHPETMTLLSVFGANDIVKNSLDLVKSNTPLPNWMNGISSYSMWWLIIQYNWYMYTGDKKYLESNKEYILNLLEQFTKYIGKDNSEKLDGMRFLDWPTFADSIAVHAGLQALLFKTFKSGSDLCKIFNNQEMGKKCLDAANRLKSNIPDPGSSKQAAAIMAISGLGDPVELNSKVMAVDGAQRLSTFYGYYVLQAKALAGDIQGCLDVIREYWGGMLKMGATTFWEDFDLNWMNNASRIDELTEPGKKDIHGDYGKYCYIGFRHSLCHGWASGPTAWMSQHILGIEPVEPGFKVVRIKPNLGDLKWAKGTFPTPYGIITVSHEKSANGKIKTKYTVPKGVSVVE